MVRVSASIATAGAASVAGLLAAAVVGLSLPARADVPPSDRIYSRAQTWACGDLGVFSALYSPWGNMPQVKWLSVAGSREEAIQVTVISGDITLTVDGQTFHFVGPENPPVRQGQEHYTCSVSAVSEDGRDSISGTAVVAVVPRALS
jgi:hypothetical protein